MLPKQNGIKLIELFKVCSFCEEQYVWTAFCEHKGYRFGRDSICKICKAIHNKAYYNINKKEILVNSSIYKKSNKIKIVAQRKAHYKMNKENIKTKKKIHYNNNKSTILAKNKEYRIANAGKIKAHKEIYYNINKSNIIAKTIKYGIEKYKIDPKFKLKKNISRYLNRSLKKNKKGKHWEHLVGYSLDQLKKHLEKQFTNGMTWKKYLEGKIHIDHKIPISVFNFTKPEHEDFKKCWALSNLRPMWAEENISKSNKINIHFQPSLLI